MVLQPGCDRADLETPSITPAEAMIARAQDAPAAPAVGQTPAGPALGAAIGRRLELAAAQAPGFTRFDLERVFGSNDLVGIDYLARGLQAARPVARLILRGEEAGYATGFLVAPQLLLTNRHVLGSADQAGSAIAEFGYELLPDGRPAATEAFRLRPDLAFVTGDPADDFMDFALVAVEPASLAGRPLADWGFLRLDDRPGKITEGEWVTIIQHPSGAHKQVALRENRLIRKLTERPVLEYHSDTAPGSSGSPCFNDQWQVVALHSRGVWKTDDAGNVKLRVGGAVPKEQLQRMPGLRDSDIDWESNLGVRTSRIVAALRVAADRPPLLDAMLTDIDRGGPAIAMPAVPATAPAPPAVDKRAEEAARRRPRPAAPPARGTGYDPDFLRGHSVPLPSLGDAARRFGEAAINRETGKPELPYTHFSVVLSAARRLAFFTAVNIDGRKSIPLERGRDKWAYDDRLPEDAQAGDWLYKEEGGNFFDRGHLVRRLDPCWGDAGTVGRANDDTFHWTNCAPQHWSFNQGATLWNGLENYILGNADEDDLLVTVFNGPVFRSDDYVHRGVGIPREYWKVVAVRTREGGLAASAYSISQARLVANIDFEEYPVGQFRTFQRPIARIERLTGLDFGDALRDADVLGAAGMPEESAREGFELARLEDVRRG
jgi:endonuclease G